MNVNYFDDDDYFLCSADEGAASHRAMLTARAVQKAHNLPNAQLGGIFSKIKKSLKRTLLFPIKVAKTSLTDPKKLLQLHKDELAQVKQDTIDFAPIVAPVAQLFPGIGTVIGLVVGVAGAQFKKEADKKKARLQAEQDRARLVEEYKAIAGTTPGRMIGFDVLQAVYNAAAETNNLPVRINFDVFNDIARKGAAAGATADQIVDAYGATVPDAAPHLSSGSLLRNIARDMADEMIARANPNAPFSYAVSKNDLQGGANDTPIASPGYQSAPNVPTVAQVAPQADSKAMELMLQNMQAQGASQSQMFSSLMSALASSGADTASPVVQAAAKQEVASVGKIKPWMIGAGVAGVGLLFFLLRKRR